MTSDPGTARAARGRRIRLSRLVAALMVIGLVGSACGARVSPSVRQAAANAVLRSGGSTAPSDSSSGSGRQATSPSGGHNSNHVVAGTQSVPGSPGTTGSSSGSQQAGTGGSAPSGNQPNGGSKSKGSGKQTGGATPTSSCPTTSSDVGLTSTTIALGTIADLSGPVSGLFAGAAQGVEAFASYINSTGGICGHSLHFDVADSGTNCSQNENDTQQLIGKDFALLGSFSLYDGCGATVLKAHPTVPDLHVGLDPAAIALPNHFDLAAGTAGALTGPFAYWAHKYGSKVQHVGTITENIPSALSEQASFVHAAESTGWKFVYSNAASPTSSNFTSQFQTMCARDHVQMVYIETETAQNSATMMANENSISACKGVINIIPIAYDQAFLPDYQGNPNSLKVEGDSEYSLFFNADEAANIPELKLFQSWFARTNPGKTSSLYSLYAWAYGRLFQQAFGAAGPTANRRTVLAALDKIHNFTAGGIMAPSNPASKTSGTHCYILWQLSNGHFSREADPKTGYRCDGKFLPKG
jgi:hypothetical protein